MSVCNKQHLTIIWGSIHKKVKQHWCRSVKCVAYEKRVYWIQLEFEVEIDSLKANKQKCIFYQIINLLKNWFLLLVFTKGKQRDKRKFITKYVGIKTTINYIYSHIELSLKFPEKCFYKVIFHWSIEIDNR